MGKPTGFMEFQRISETYEKAEKRVTHYREFVPHLSDADAKTAGCALHGLRHSVLQQWLPGQ